MTDLRRLPRTPETAHLPGIGNQPWHDDTRQYSYGYSPNGSLISIYDNNSGSLVETVTSDAFGQVVSQGGNRFTYDALGRVTSTSSPYGQLTYSGLSNTLASDETANYSYTPDDALFGITVPGRTARIAVTDQHDDVVAQLDPATGTVAAGTTYDPFGKVTDTSGKAVGHLGYQSGWTDPTTGRVNMWSRWYDPTQSRFISRDEANLDPIPEPVAANRYAYLDDNPFSGIDPLGTCNPFKGSCWKSIGDSITGAANTVARGVTGASNTVADGVTGAANAVADGVTGAAETVGHAVADGYEAAKQGVVTAAQTTATFVKDHAGTIVSIAVGILVYAACDAVVTAATAGVGSLAGAVACGMLSGAVSGAVEHAVDAAAGNTEFSWKEMGLSMAIGAAAGAAGELGGRALSKVTPFLKRALTRGDDAVETVLSRGARVSALADDAGESGLGRFVDDACGMMHSFAPDTKVVMADGSRKPIGEVKLGDKVLATNPDTGTTEAKPVVALHHNKDTDLTDVTVRVPAPRTSTEDGAARQADAARPAAMKDVPPTKDQAQDPKSGTSTPQAPAALGNPTAATGSATPATVTVTLHTTSHHPFWDQTTGTWANAADLKPGDHLHALGSNEAVVVAVHSWTGHADMNDLTIDDTHTYYVVTADTPVLVHNVSGGKCAKKVAKKGYELIIKPPKRGWNKLQWKEALEKIKGLNKAKLVKTDVAGKRHGTASGRWKSAGKTKPANHDIDHVIELQLGGADDIKNMKPLDASVNRSFGSQFKNQLKYLPKGARIRGVRLVPRK